MSNSSKKVLITGASTGFGKITAQELAKDGHHVFATMRNISGTNAEHAKSLTNWANENNVSLQVVELDVTSDDSVKQAAETVLAKTNGTIDVIINNAGIYAGGLQESFTVEDYKVFFEVNVFGTVRVNNTFLPTLRKQGSGLIIQISSVLGRTIIPFGGVYDATKWAVEALSENLAYELKPLGIDVAIVQPGPFATEIFQKQPYQPGNAALAANYGKPTEIMAGFFGQFTAQMLDPEVPNKPIHVAEAIVKLVNTPQGQVPLRTVVDKMMGGTTEAINEATQKVQTGLLQNLGFGELVKN